MNFGLLHVNGRTRRSAPTIIVSLFAFLLLFTPFARAVTVDSASPVVATQQQAFKVEVTDISNHAYYPAVLEEINNAHISIYVAMYSMYTRANEPDSAPYKLITALIDAHKRGVAVTVYLDQTGGNAKSNMAAYEMLNTAGVKVYLIDPKVKLHAKVIVIDNKVVVDGSSNWTQRAMGDLANPSLIENFESDYIFRSEALAKTKLLFFKALDEFKITGNDKKPVEVVKISGKFLTDSRFCPGLVASCAGNALRMYLKLLRDNKTGQSRCEAIKGEAGWVDVDYVAWAQYLRLKVDQGAVQNRVQLRGVVDDLKNRYHLLDYKLGEGLSLKVRLVDYDDKSKDYVPPGENYFSLPMTFWGYGLDRKLSDIQAMTYFISLYEQACQWPKAYWSLGFFPMAEKYHISKTTQGRRVINIHDLIVLPQYRKNGIARTLLTAVEAKARRLDCCKVTLEVREDNLKAKALYRSQGFSAGKNPMSFWVKPL